MKTKSALSHFGSDSECAPELAKMLNHCKHVTITFCGGLSILPHLTARAIVANDLNDLAINFYRVADGDDREAQAVLLHRCDRTLSHPSEIKEAEDYIRLHQDEMTEDVCKIDLAWAYWALCWIGRKGTGGTKHLGGLPSVRRKATGGTNATRIRAAANDLDAWAKHFERCEWECKDFREILDSCADDPTCGIYCDPPWVGAGRNYLHSFTQQDHIDLRNKLDRFEQTTVVVRYGDDPFIRNWYADWTIVEAASRTQANKAVGEIWLIKNGDLH